MVKLLTWPTDTPAFLASCDIARFWSRRVMANQRSAGTFGACDRAIRQLVLHGLATVRIRTSGPATSLIALPWPVKIGPLARIKSARLMPSLRGRPPTKIANATDKAAEGFAGVDWAVLVGALPRKEGMRRADLIRANGPIFTGQGKAINEVAGPNVRVLVVANPCNTNGLIARSHAPKVPADRWFAMT